MKHLAFIVLLLLAAYMRADETSDAESQNNTETACRNSYWNLEALRRDDSDYESSEFKYLGLKWVVVFNFCRDTVRSCMFNHFPAFLNSRHRGTRCTPTLTSGDWGKAKYELDYNNGTKVAVITWPSKLRGSFQMRITCSNDTNYRFIRLDTEEKIWKMYLESSYVC
eukprot:TRINITY_DN6441_c0_g1_i2.p2 TRINITY_DN6441_c0_g1~~TRINITY_DN6441_c0_g1_i2.p2  ORF type:complete len:167 (-),score=35.57 TRINITY_DN6441_c0_g1_i2:139-639(-)